MTANTRRKAFTLVELLVTIGVIFLLVTLVIVALGSVRSLANRTESINALRSMAAAYNTYSADNQQRLMPGYIDPTQVEELNVRPRLQSGNRLPLPAGLDQDDASSYVWRLAPYLDHHWETMFIDYRSEPVIDRISQEIFAGQYGPGTTDPQSFELGASLTPSFGLNSLYLGGDNVHGGQDLTKLNPWTGDPGATLAATRLSEVRNPTRVILFAPTVHWTYLDENPENDMFQNTRVGGVKFGYPELRPPTIRTRSGDVYPQWRFGSGLQGQIVLEGDFQGSRLGGGIPIARWDHNMVPLAHLDGSTSSEDINVLAADVEGIHWSPWVTRIR